MGAPDLFASKINGLDARNLAHQDANAENINWAMSLLDTSRLATLAVSLFLIIYGSFRATKTDKNKEDIEEEDGSSSSFLWEQGHTIESAQALLLPFGASMSLLIMFFFFDSLQLLFTLMTAVLATVAFSFLLLPLFQYLTSPCFNPNIKISFGICGRFTSAEVMSLIASAVIVLMWILTGHWLLMDALAMALCIAMIAFVRLPSLKVSVLLLFGLLVYDVFWVFFSEYIFKVNVMVKVATQPAYNPVNSLAYNDNSLPASAAKGFPKLSLPGKLVFPSSYRTGHFSMLGLGDIVMPGLLLCFVLRFDNHKKRMNLNEGETSKITYFHCSLIGYFVGLLTATTISELSKSAQPALLYLVPFTILPLITRAYVKGDLKNMWQNPFNEPNKGKELEV
ncbi:signal peptide peptidase-like 3 [Rhopilema esculentum]|uniref:signal peptide peptidase-like 3 n=1 Tax=Rhopilema esculentum TaxID=499914 RepID=UPI0031E26AB6|eukprot:gene15505-6765_t